MKILLIGEYSNVHATLADGLRALGHQVTVASNGDFWKNYPRDIDLARKPGKIGGMLLMAKILTLLPSWRNYDVVQLIGPMFVELKAEHNFRLYKSLRRHNKKVFLGVHGNDHFVIDACCNKKVLRYSDFNIGDQMRDSDDIRQWKKLWLHSLREKMNRYMAATADGITPGLYEYYACYQPVFPDKTCFIPYPIKVLQSPQPEASKEPPGSRPLRVFIGISKGRSVYKGTDIMLKAAQHVAAKYPEKMKLQIAEGIPFAQYEKMMDGSDVQLDQLYSYTPSMNSLLAMSKGIVVVGGGEPENYAILDETELRPIVNVEPTYESVCQELEQLIMHPECIPTMKQQSIAYIKKHHDYLKVAMQYISFWNRRFH